MKVLKMFLSSLRVLAEDKLHEKLSRNRNATQVSSEIVLENLRLRDRMETMQRDLNDLRDQLAGEVTTIFADEAAAIRRAFEEQHMSDVDYDVLTYMLQRCGVLKQTLPEFEQKIQDTINGADESSSAPFEGRCGKTGCGGCD